MGSRWERIRTQWALCSEAYDRIQGAQNPWEHKGPLRWVHRYGRGWELNGSALPTDDEAARDHDRDG